MSTTIERVQSIRVTDAMSRKVITLSASSTMTEAAGVLAQHHISGVPVVNELGQIVGILSTTDFARRHQSQNDSHTQATSAYETLDIIAALVNSVDEQLAEDSRKT